MSVNETGIPVSSVDDKADAGYRKELKSRHMRMIAIGGAIGSGLFYGASGRINEGGPAVALIYLLCGGIAYLMLRALGEMVIHRPSSGGFISYAREFQGEAGAYYTGWFAFTTWSCALMADITAIAGYMHYWEPLRVLPQWAWALIALTLVVIINLASVKFFGEFEFWFAMIKVAAIVVFMVLAVGLIVLGINLTVPVGETTQTFHPGFSLITEHGGWFPSGGFALVAMSLGVLFAYGGTEYIGLAAGEAKDPHKEMPRAVNSLMWRILLFYVGSVFLFTLLLPHNVYNPNESPFVTIFTAVGVPGAGSIMNFVVLIAAASAINAELYAAGRGLRSLAYSGSAPRFLRHMNHNDVPSTAIITAAAVGLVGVLINMVYPSDAFLLTAFCAGIGICTMWGSIMISHMLFVRQAKLGLVKRGKFRLWWAPFSNLLVLAVLALMVVLIVNTGFWGQVSVIAFLCLTALLTVVWFAIRSRVHMDTFDQAAATADNSELDQFTGV